ncbi:MAG: outer membrane protein assembly factor BamA [Gammaproteobacteria bacterium]|nr:outer membrane protein assembly factor BamA [Gammaproteobacteria bacterium]
MGLCRRLLPVLLLCALIPASALAEMFVVRDIRVDGLQRIAAGTVFSYLPVKVGERMDSAQTPEIVRSLYRTGFFKDVRLEREGDVLVITVEERPAIAEINISGNKAIDTKDLKQGLKDVGLAEGRTFNKPVLDKIEAELRRQYFNQGKYGVKIESTVTPLERNRVAIGIDIVEGETATIKKINIVGNKAFKESELLGEFKQTTGGWLSFLTKDDQYSKQKLSGDLETLRSFYLDRGYLNFRIDSTQVTITPDKQDIYITVNLTEGDLYRIADVKLAGDLVVAPEELFPLIQLTRGEPFSRKRVVESAERVTRKLGDQGYAFANVNPSPQVDEEKKTVELTYFVDPGKRVYVRRITFKGNAKTRDEVLRREFRQMESAWFSGEQVKRSRERLQRLGFFETVTIETPAVAGSADEIDVEATVKERSAGTLTAGVGYSQSQGVLFNASVVQDNFMGTGKRVALAFNNSQVNTIYALTYVNPYFTPEGISRGFSLRYRSTDFNELNTTSQYLTDVAAAGVNFGIPINETDRINFALDVTNTKVKLGSGASLQLIDFVRQYGDEYLDFPVAVTWSRDSRDRAIFPTSGAIQRFVSEITLPGSDLEYWKAGYSHRRYFPLSKTFTLSLNIDLGYGDGYGDTTELPFFSHYYAGGYGTVRGYKLYSLGPKDSTGKAYGGNIKTVANAELLFPMPGKAFSDTVRLATFVDAGNVFLDSFDAGELRYSAGVGATWMSPVGVLTISAAKALNEQDGDETEIFQFQLGQSF